MSDFKLIAQDAPVCSTKPCALIVSKVQTREEAFVLVYDLLTRQGKVISTFDSDLNGLGLNIAVIRRAGIEAPVTQTSTKIRSLEPYNVRKSEGTIRPCSV